MKRHACVQRRRECLNSEQSLKAAALLQQPTVPPLSDYGRLESGRSRPSSHNLNMQP